MPALKAYTVCILNDAKKEPLYRAINLNMQIIRQPDAKIRPNARQKDTNTLKANRQKYTTQKLNSKWMRMTRLIYFLPQTHIIAWSLPTLMILKISVSILEVLHFSNTKIMPHLITISRSKHLKNVTVSRIPLSSVLSHRQDAIPWFKLPNQYTRQNTRIKWLLRNMKLIISYTSHPTPSTNGMDRPTEP